MALPPCESGYMHGAIVLRTNLRKMPLVTISAKGYRSPAVMVTPRIVSLPLAMNDDVERWIFIRPTDRQLLKLTGTQR